MEDFIRVIYNKSFVISKLKEFIYLLNSGQALEARSLYNEMASELEQWLLELADSSPAIATNLQDIAIEIKDCYDDSSHCQGLIHSRLLPKLYSCMSDYNTINVSSGNYSLMSTDTGFLTIKDESMGLFLGDIYDPMQEAHQIIRSRYKPEMKSFFILGCGLGYEAYQIYHQSDGAVMVFLYEEDSDIINFAQLYGVLSLIPDDNIEIIQNDSIESLAAQFINDINVHDCCGFYITPSKKMIYDGVCDGELNRITANHELMIETCNQRIINLWKNRVLGSVAFSDVQKHFQYDEWVIISAGPSLDYNIPFLKERKDNRGLIAVNTVLRRMKSENIKPDIIAAADPANSLKNHIEGAEKYTEDITLVADWLLSWKYTAAYQGQICFVRTNASADITADLSDNDSVWDISGTVTCLAIESAVRLGAKKIYLVGQDLAYPNGQRYAGNMPHAETPDAKWQMKVPSTDGTMVETCEAFEWFRKAIEYQIAKYKKVEFINMSLHGAMIKGTSIGAFS